MDYWVYVSWVADFKRLMATKISIPQAIWFLLRGFLKDSVYPYCPHALEELQVNIQHTIAGISNETLKNGSITRFIVEDYVQTIMTNTLHSFIIY